MLKTGRKPASATQGGEPLDRLQALHRAGKVAEAISALKPLIEAQPKSARLRVLLAEWLAKAGRNEEAVKTLFELQELLIATDNLLAAISAGLKIVELDPSFENPLSYVAKVNSDRLRSETRKKVSFLSGVPRTASAVAVEDTERLRIDRDTLSELTVEHPRLVTVLKEFHLDRVQNAMQVAKASARA